jgi:hypothetical protein
MARESAGNDAAAYFQRAAADLAVALWRQSTLANPAETFAQRAPEERIWLERSGGPIGRCKYGSRNRGASLALIYQTEQY